MILKPRLFRKPKLSIPISKGLVGLWLMNEGSGNIVQDLSGNGNNASITAGENIVWAAGQTGSATKYEESAVDVLATTLTDVAAQDMTLIIKFKIDDLTNEHDVFGFNTNFYMHRSGGSTVLRTTGGGWSSLNIGTVAANVWYVSAITITGTTVTKGYLDGAFVREDADITGLAGGSPFVLGDRNVVPHKPFKGLIEYCYIYNRVLSASEIQQLYREPFCMFYCDPIELWTGAMGGGVPPIGNAGIMTCNTGYWGA